VGSLGRKGEGRSEKEEGRGGERRARGSEPGRSLLQGFTEIDALL